MPDLDQLQTLVFDIGATHTRLALTDGKTLLKVQRFNTDSTNKGIDQMLDVMSDFIEGRKLGAVCGGLPGQLDRTTDRLVHAPNLPGWLGRRVAREIQQHVRVPVTVRNDTELVGLGEAVYGAGRGFALVVYVTISTGVNGVRIANGIIDSSARGFELGAQLVTGPDGKPQALESLTGGAALEKTYGCPPAGMRHDRVLWHKEAGFIAEGLYNTLLHWSPDVVVLGGSMMRDIDVAEVASDLRRLPAVFADWPPLKRAELADDGGLLGAMALSRG